MKNKIVVALMAIAFAFSANGVAKTTKAAAKAAPAAQTQKAPTAEAKKGTTEEAAKSAPTAKKKKHHKK